MAYQMVFEYIETFYNTVRIHSHCDDESQTIMSATLGNEKISIKCVRNIDIVPLCLFSVTEAMTMIKCLYWNKSGFWLLHKRLEEGRFKWEKSSDGLCIEISHRQLQWLLEGLKMTSEICFQRA